MRYLISLGGRSTMSSPSFSPSTISMLIPSLRPVLTSLFTIWFFPVENLHKGFAVSELDQAFRDIQFVLDLVDHQVRIGRVAGSDDLLSLLGDLDLHIEERRVLLPFGLGGNPGDLSDNFLIRDGADLELRLHSLPDLSDVDFVHCALEDQGLHIGQDEEFRSGLVGRQGDDRVSRIHPPLEDRSGDRRPDRAVNLAAGYFDLALFDQG